jgi:hypothetical protein
LRQENEERKEKGEAQINVIIILEAMHGKDYIKRKPTFEGYTLLDQQPAEKEDNKQGRGSGGTLTFLRNETGTPVQILKEYHTLKECIPLCITGKIPGHRQERDSRTGVLHQTGKKGRGKRANLQENDRNNTEAKTLGRQ